MYPVLHTKHLRHNSMLWVFCLNVSSLTHKTLDLTPCYNCHLLECIQSCTQNTCDITPCYNSLLLECIQSCTQNSCDITPRCLLLECIQSFTQNTCDITPANFHSKVIVVEGVSTSHDAGPVLVPNWGLSFNLTDLRIYTYMSHLSQDIFQPVT